MPAFLIHFIRMMYGAYKQEKCLLHVAEYMCVYEKMTNRNISSILRSLFVQPKTSRHC